MARVDRGVSTAVGYVLNLGIATLLVTGLLVAGSGLVADQRERAAGAELDVIGNRIAADLETADRLVRNGNGSVTVRTSLPNTVAGSSYRVAIESTGGNATVIVSTNDPSLARTVPVVNETPIRPTTVSGGSIVVRGNQTGLEVTDG
ncbi:hypothetical protein RH831_07475 [Halodesulfurarchaeum sp. HSR-GB]|uniref:DUF7266 family protein n=1 Tax=Halodesulfurarchaeum sp. HSR-GB TaxID=3074077 RepID=UPI00285A1507|nr:hypothetical protein [Halodesulfurarchaeum sp. HSR-GB]MDR5657021.1 hypothetical protein [Halodesulfurarchaeum sp. HSR-GB]